jgi:diaminohydroxyphosphoribosylaminopyrimidine deaminase / 5-amino-6-(5-phosphoribosylamino)uracil reductase
MARHSYAVRVATRRTQPSSDNVRWMTRAVELAALCETEPGRAEESPRVGAVAVSATGVLIAEAHRGELDAGDHAEYCLIKKLGGKHSALAGATVYTTLEPCTTRNEPKIPCADRLIAERAAIVYIGTLDPDPRVRELGWRRLRDAGVELRDFTEDLRRTLHEMNQPFEDRFSVGIGLHGSITFDYMQNRGMVLIETGIGPTFTTRWGRSGPGSIQALGSDGSIALVSEARSFDEIDDPGLYEFAGHAKRPRLGQIVIFRQGSDYCLVQLDGVLVGATWGDDRTEAKISWEVRAGEG